VQDWFLLDERNMTPVMIGVGRPLSRLYQSEGCRCRLVVQPLIMVSCCRMLMREQRRQDIFNFDNLGRGPPRIRELCVLSTPPKPLPKERYVLCLLSPPRLRLTDRWPSCSRSLLFPGIEDKVTLLSP